MLTSDVDPRDQRFVTGERTGEGFYRVRCGMEQAVARGLAYAPHADLIWFETGTPDLEEAREFAAAIHVEYPGKLLSYNCSPSFNWKAHLDDDTVARFQRELGSMGYRYQFITLAGFHALNYSIFDLATRYRESGAGYFDSVTQAITGGTSSITALAGSTEAEQFEGHGEETSNQAGT